MTTPNVYWIDDPGHAWLAVNMAEYPRAVNYGTGFGYRDTQYVYLEEDCEAPAFLADYPELQQLSVSGGLVEKRYDDNAPVRNYRPNVNMQPYA